MNSPKNSLLVGQQTFYWSAQPQFPPASVRVEIVPADRLGACLLVDILDLVGTEYFTAKEAKMFIEYALDKGWLQKGNLLEYSCLRVEKGGIWEMQQSIQEEKMQAQEIAGQLQKITASLDFVVRWAALTDAEKVLKITFPSLFKQLYTHISDGGFGPDSGFLPIWSGKKNVVQLNVRLRVRRSLDPAWQLPAAALFFLDWGHGVYSYIDCSLPQAPVWVLDVNSQKSQNGLSPCCWLHCDSFADWVNNWRSGSADGRELFSQMYQKRGWI